MASYKVHDRVTIYSAIGLAPFCYWAAQHYSPTLWGHPLSTTPWMTTLLVIGAYLFSGLWLSNDLDIDSRIYRRWGALALALVSVPKTRVTSQLALPRVCHWSSGARRVFVRHD